MSHDERACEHEWRRWVDKDGIAHRECWRCATYYAWPVNGEPRAGVAKGTVYYNFASKAALFEEVHTQSDYIQRYRLTKLAIVGSRHLTTQQADLVHVIIDAVLDDYPDDAVICSGGAPGVDTMAITRAHQAGRTTRLFLPHHQRWEPDGYKARNMLIASWCDDLVAIMATDSKTFGSGWTANYAESLGKNVRRLYV